MAGCIEPSRVTGTVLVDGHRRPKNSRFMTGYVLQVYKTAATKYVVVVHCGSKKLDQPVFSISTNRLTYIIMVALWNRADHYIFALWLLLLSFFPRLI